MKYSLKRILIAVLAAGVLLAGASLTLAIGPGDGNLLKRTPDETCHGCHKTDKNAPSDPNAIKTHKGPSSSKWPGGWGVTGGEYGEFLCTTCHTPHDTRNIYLIRESIPTPDGSNWPSGSPNVTVDFRYKTGLAGTVGVMGDDTACFLPQYTDQPACQAAGGTWNAGACSAPNKATPADCTAASGTWSPRTTSTRVCEVCHSKNKYHNYDSTNNAVNNPPGDFSHNNAGDCNGCHPHSEYFMPAGGACNSCHGASGSSGAPLITSDLVQGANATGSTNAGKHQKHTVSLGLACSTCHTSYTMPDSTSHAIDIGFNIFGTGGGAYRGQSAPNVNYMGRNGTDVSVKDNSRSCTNIYCHSSAQGSSGTGAPVYASPQWLDTAPAMNCGNCHKDMSTDAAAPGSHVKHVNSATGYNMPCSNCHNGAVPPASSVHVNNTINVSLDAAYGGSYNGSDSTPGNHAPGQGYGTCSTTYCHSDGLATPVAYQSPQWGNASSGACGTCHGVVAATPPASSPHTKHTGTAANYRFSCSKCHDSVVNSTADSTTQPTIKDASTHADKNRQVQFDSYNSGGTYNGTNCNTIYCHSRGTGGTSQAGDVRPVSMPASLPVWSATTTCGSCHGDGSADGRPSYASGSPKANSHGVAKHASLTCDKCHNQTTTTGSTITNTANHVNKTYNVTDTGSQPYTFTYSYNANGGSCSTGYCHGASSPAWGTTGSLTCASCHTSMGAGGAAGYTGKHQKHVDVAGYDFSCEMCHSQANGTSHVNGPVSAGSQSAQVAFRNTTTAWQTGQTYNGSTSTYKYRSLGNNPYNAESSVSPSYTSAGTAQADGSLSWRDAGTCSIVWCHSNANPVGGTNSYSTVAWNSVVGCASCHRSADTTANMQAAGTPEAMSAAHVKHLATDKYGANVNYNCSACHNATASDNGTISNVANHVNASKDFALGTFNGIDQSVGSYAGSGGACSSTYCHSKGQSTAAPFTAPMSAANWSGTTSTCTTCHAGPDTAANVAANGPAGKHAVHIATDQYGLSCDECHAETVANDSTDTLNASTGYAKHVNAVKDRKFSTTLRSTTVDQSNGSYSGGQCSNIYCHSKGTVLGGGTYNQATNTPVTTPNWNTTSLGCNGCHGDGAGTDGMPAYVSGSPKVNSHSKHVTDRSITCDQCHNGTTTTGTTITDRTLHVNAAYDMSAGGTYNGQSVAFSTSGSPTSCSAISCHGGSSATWGSTFDCTGCHEASQTLGGRHAQHYATATNATMNSTGRTASATAYIFNCGTCHSSPPTTHMNGPANGATGRQAEMGFNVTWATGYTGGTHAEGNAYANDSRGFKYSTNNTCSSVYCHSDGKPLGTAEPVYQVVTWDQAAASPNCGICHATTPATNKHAVHASTYGLGCVECHQATVSNNTTISDKDKHVNFAKDVAWKTGGFNADGTAYSSPNCSNIYCHSQGTANAQPYPAPNTAAAWNGSLSAECTGCHKGDAAATGGLFMNSNKHAEHVSNTAVMGVSLTCDTCHSDTVAAGQNRTLNASTGLANHVNKQVNIVFTSLNSGASYTGSSIPGDAVGSCNSLYCHSNGKAGTGVNAYTNPAWSGAAIGCNGCHGTGNAKGYPDYASGAAGSNTSNSHARHAGTAAGQANYSCSACHYTVTTNGTAINGSSPSLHINADTQNVSFDAAYGGTFVPGGGTPRSCNTVYCHSNVQGNTGSGTPSSYATPQWGGSTLNCGSCHVNMSTDATGTGSHKMHAGSTGNAQYSCSVCHGTGYDATTAVYPSHASATINLSMTGNATGTSYTKGTSITPGSAVYGSCSTSNCHGSGTPTWGNNTATTSCEKCHGSVVTNPFYDTSGNTSAADVQVGAHRVHLAGTSNYSSPIACSECHTAPATVNAAGHIDSALPAEVPLAGTLSMTNPRGVAGTPTYGGGSCSNIYCHDGSRFKNGWSAGTNPTWSDTAYLNSTVADCSKCHAYPPAAPHSTDTNCVSCHDHVNATNDGFADKTKHINGSVEGGGCNGCHDYDTVGATWTGTEWTGGTWGKNSKDGLTPNEGWGAHAKHINHIKTRLSITGALTLTGASYGLGEAANVCGTCHTNIAGNHTTGGSTTGRLINFGDGIYKTGGAAGFSFVFGSVNPAYNGSPGVSSATTPKTCSSISCHFSTTPLWSTY